MPQDASYMQEGQMSQLYAAIETVRQKRAEAFVRDVLTNVFRQKVSERTIRAVAMKVVKSIP
jgi:hypothetical protein